MLRPLVALLAIGAGSAVAETPRVVTDIAPVQSLVAQVMQGTGTPETVIRHGASPHAYRLRPSDAAALSEADLIFWVGGNLTPWMPAVLGSLAPDAATVELIETEGTIELPFRENAVFDGHSGDDGHDHDHHGSDPHAWLDPENAKIWLNVIAAELGRADPDNAKTYLTNAAQASAAMEAVAADIRDALAPVRNRTFIVFHDAYQYFETRFGLSAAGAISLSDASDPSAARIAEIRDYIARNEVACVFAEPQFNPGLIASVLEGSTAKTAILDPLGTDIAPGPGFHAALLQQIADRIAGCL
ncbi:MAG: zinc ABC transporter substrate-binding protein [Rhodobacter sp.]|nr:zinc ABC transporter substrate-binding protein [Rhodobacter sp.]